MRFVHKPKASEEQPTTKAQENDCPEAIPGNETAAVADSDEAKDSE